LETLHRCPRAANLNKQQITQNAQGKIKEREKKLASQCFGMNMQQTCPFEAWPIWTPFCLCPKRKTRDPFCSLFVKITIIIMIKSLMNVTKEIE
jgi:hypothetical protein